MTSNNKNQHQSCNTKDSNNSGSDSASCSAVVDTSMSKLIMPNTVKNLVNFHTCQIDSLTIHQLQNAPKKSDDIIYGMFDFVSSFRGRCDKIIEIDNSFKTDGMKIIAICGPAGIGKTELARYYATKNKTKYKNILWTKGETCDNLHEDFKEIAKDLGLNSEQNKNLARNVYLHFEKSQALFIIDNALNEQIILGYLPTKISHANINIHVLITTQVRNWSGDIIPINIDKLSIDESIEVFQAVLGDKFDHIKEKTQWKNLAIVFDGYPLALQISAAYINKRLSRNFVTDFSINEYVKLLEQEDEFLNKKLLHNNYERSIYSSLKITTSRIQKDNTNIANLALQVMNVCSFLDPDSISYDSLLEFNCISKPEYTSEEMLNIRVDSSSKSDMLNNILDILEQNALITLTTASRKIQIHPLVQRFFRYDQKRNNDYHFFQQALFIKSKHIFPYCNEISVLKYTRNLKQFLRSIPEMVRKSFIDDSYLLHKSARCYYPETIKIFLKEKADPNKIAIIDNVNCSGTPSYYMTWGRVNEKNVTDVIKCISLLVSYGADVTINSGGSNLLHWAGSNVCYPLIKYLTDKCKIDVNLQDWKGNIALHYIVMTDKSTDKAKNCIDILAKKRANFNIKNENNESVLDLAAKYYQTDLLEYLLKKYGLDISENDKKYRDTILHRILNFNLVEDMQKTIDIIVANAPEGYVHLKDDTGWTILYYATKERCIDMIDFLITKYKMNVNEQDFNGQTPLHIALAQITTVQKEDVVIFFENTIKAIVDSLLEHNADINIENKYGVTPYNLVVEYGLKSLINLQPLKN